jgi:hypothetical protein
MRKAAPWRAALDSPVGELQVLHDRVRDQIAVGVSERPARAANFEGQRVAHVRMDRFSDI